MINDFFPTLPIPGIEYPASIYPDTGYNQKYHNLFWLHNVLHGDGGLCLGLGYDGALATVTDTWL